MRLKWLIVTGILLFAVNTAMADTQELKTDKDKLSYAIGVDIARNFKQQEIAVDIDVLIRGLGDGLSGSKLLMSEDDIKKTVAAFQAEIRKKLVLAQRALAEENKRKGEAFLDENKKKEGVVTLASGLQYKILKKSEGKIAADDDSVECNYRGTLIDGTEFDSSYKTGHPATFKVAGVIPGFREALKLMPAGSKWQLFIPPQLAYGERGAGREIGPNSTLIFEVEVLAIK